MGMKILKRGGFSLTFFSMLIAGALIVAGCSGGGGTASVSGGGTTGGDTGGSGSSNPYAGKATISGSVDVSGLSSSDQALLTKALPKRLIRSGSLQKQLYATDYTSDAVAKLYIVGEDGELEDTELTGTLSTDDDGNPVYEFDGVKDGIDYVVRYVKLVGDGQVLELKGNVSIAEGATAPSETATISPKTTVVVQALVDAILNATNGTGISQSIVTKIITAVKAAVVQLVDSGAIQVPSMIVKASGNTIDDIAATNTKNSELANTSGVLLSDTTVDANLGAAKVETLAANFDIANVTTDADKLALINRVFKEMIGDDGIPQFMVNFMTDKYIENVTKTVGQVMDAIANGLHFNGAAPDITKSSAIASFKDELTYIYSLMDKKSAGTITAAEKLDLAEVPPVFLGLFPISERATWTNLTTSTPLNVPQGLAMTVYIVDVYIEDTFEEMQATYSASEAGGGSGMNYEKEHPYDFNPMQHGSLMDMLGFYDVYQNYTGLDIFELWVHPGKAWIETAPGNGREVDMLSAGTCISDVASMVYMFRPELAVTPTDLSGASVTLTYPKADGTTGTINLISESSLWGGPDGSGPGGMGDSCFILEPWREASAGQEPGVDMGPIQPDPDRIVSDFASGTYTVSVNVNGNTMTRSFTKKVITGMTKAYPTLVSPAGFPQWPGNGASQEEIDAHNEAMAAFEANGGSTRYAANVDTDGDGTSDAAKITVTWKAPTVTLPAGVKVGYHLNVGKGGCDQSGCTWEHIFSTWDRDKILFTTSYTLPINIPKQDTTDPKSYNLNLDLVFIDSTTGEHLGQGGHAHAEFRVADPLDTSKTFTITGSAVNGYKVVLFRESENPDSLTNRFTRTTILEAEVVDGTYTLEPRISDFLDNTKGWFNIIMYQDSDGNGSFNNSDMQIWPDWNSGTHIWFNTWGGLLRVGKDTCSTPSDGSTCVHSETLIFGGETVTGPSFTEPSGMSSSPASGSAEGTAPPA